MTTRYDFVEYMKGELFLVVVMTTATSLLIIMASRDV